MFFTAKATNGLGKLPDDCIYAFRVGDSNSYAPFFTFLLFHLQELSRILPQSTGLRAEIETRVVRER
jgi:hypothetical protein